MKNRRRLVSLMFVGKPTARGRLLKKILEKLISQQQAPVVSIAVPLHAYAEMGMPEKIAGLSCGEWLVSQGGRIEVHIEGTAATFDLDPDLPEALLRCVVKELRVTAPLLWRDFLALSGLTPSRPRR